MRCEGVQRATAKPSARLRRGEILLPQTKECFKKQIRACAHECIYYHCKQDKACKDNVEFVVASENPPEPLDSPKESFNLISSSVEYLIIFPWVTAILLWGNNRIITKLLGYSSHVVALISAIHEK